VPGARDAEAVLITGAYGTGKSSLAAQIADMLEDRGLRYAALDLDWLAWGYPGSEEASAEHRMMMRNLAPVVSNYHEAGVRFFVFSRAFTERWELEDLIAGFPFPLRLVRLAVPPEVIEERLRDGIEAGRHDELREVTEQVSRTEVPGVEDLTVSNDRPLVETASEILDWLGWLE
jgi:adenylylsulfate kinase-like enzyme